MADTSQTIQGFYTQAQVKDFARNNLFRVLNINFGTGTQVSFDENDLVYATAAQLPGKTINNIAVPYMGLNFNVPGTVKYPGSEAWQVQFRCDEGINIRTKMENFTREIFDDETSTGLYGVPIEEATMDLLGKDLEPVRRYTFVGLYPVSVGTLGYDVKDDGEPLTMDLTFAYQFYRTDR